MKKSFLLSIFVVLNFSFAMGTDLKLPIDKKTIITSIKNDTIEGIKAGRPGLNIGLVGDWNSSGSTELPYTPTYDFSYHCQAQITDGLVIGTGSSSYKFYEISEFDLNNSVSSVWSKNLSWYGKKILLNQSVLDTDSPSPFSLAGDVITLSFRPSSVGNDVVRLTLSLQQPSGGAIATETTSVDSLRSETAIQGSVRMNFISATVKPVANLSLKVRCEKVK